jgi:serine/threonine-protein kinase
MIGQTLSHYLITKKLGQGGMGEVYRAEDTNLSRQVAIKVLPDEFAHDAERLARFEREAKLLASLNHPNIASIYGLEEHEGKRFLVLELVEGQTLAERLKKGRIPVDETLDVCRQIAEGLEAAHEKGIIHRDLKPSNVKVTPEGKVKVLDFGLAKAFQGESSAPDVSKFPTLTSQMTHAGVILGTAAYMSPEQAKGKAVDKRADIWAFGCVLYECLAARRPFDGETVAETMAAILRGEPEWDALPVETPPGIRRLLRRCLARETVRRLGDIHDAWLEIQDSGAVPEAEPAAGRERQFLRRWSVPLAVALILGFTTFYALRYWSRRAAPAGVTSLVRFGMPVTLADKRSAMLAISPAGDILAYVGEREGNQQIFLRRMDHQEATPMDGTENARGPFFSPDGRWIGFFADGKLKKMSVTGGAATEICEAVDGKCGSWGADDTIVFVPRWASGLQSVPATGGKPKNVTTLDAAKGEVSHIFPQILPAGKAILYTVSPGDVTSMDDAQIAVQRLEQPEHRILTLKGTCAHYVATGHLVYARKGKLLAVPFDLTSLQVGREAPDTILDDVLTDHTGGFGHFAVSTTGTLAYVSGGVVKGDQFLALVDRNGVPRPLLTDVNFYFSPTYASDGRIAVVKAAANDDIWIIDPPDSEPSRFTFGGGDNQSPVWTMPKGDRIIFAWGSSGVKNL